ncbi:MAG: hypothetical protein LIP28_10635 [Deltaproteobacteria bacterium]|nr:hypothetical protein [Deltaproteobacteria bacterium]
MELKTILERYAGIVMDRQHVLAERLGAHDWGADTETGMFFFNGPNLESPFQVIGTLSKATGEWLWGWANASLPGDLAQMAHGLFEFGKAEGVDLFTRDRFPADKEDLHALGVAACGLGGARAYYLADYGDGVLLAALTGEGILSDWKPDHPRVFTVFPRVIQTFDVDHKTALVRYLEAAGYTVREEGGILADKDGNMLTAAFDDLGRLAELKGGLGK